MLTKLRVRNFKRFADVEIELGQSVVLIGPNNSGKTTALQALTLWDLGIRQWIAARGMTTAPSTRPGVTINRRDLVAIPVPSTNLLWRNLHVRESDREAPGKPRTRNLRLDVIVEGITDSRAWTCGLEFDYSNEESLVCRLIRQPGHENSPVKGAQFTSLPFDWKPVRLAMLPPMSGLAAVEPKWEPGRINVLLGEGQTAQVLRNTCYLIYQQNAATGHWTELVAHIDRLFGAQLQPPEHIVERGEITMKYQEAGVQLDLGSAGRGLQQTLLLLGHLYANPGAVLLLDEPDAHLEILRQRQIYQLITGLAERQRSQIIAASHSEIILNEAADRHVVVAFVGRPHRIDDRGGRQTLKTLREIGFDQYYSAEQRGWVLYLEGSSDLSMLSAFAETLEHPARAVLDGSPFVHYVMNQPDKAKNHFYGLREAKPDLQAIAIFDHLGADAPRDPHMDFQQWERRELENYLASESVLVAYANHPGGAGDLFGQAEAQRRVMAMNDAIAEVAGALRTLGKDPFGPHIKASDEFLRPLFDLYFNKLSLPNVMRKANFGDLARLVPADQIDPEITEKLDAIVQTAAKARGEETT